MKKLLILVAFLFAALAHGQQGNTVLIRFPGVPSGDCSVIMVAVDDATGDYYDCDAAGNWFKVGPGGGGGVATVTATAPILSSGGPNPDISCPTCLVSIPRLDQIFDPLFDKTFAMGGKFLFFDNAPYVKTAIFDAGTGYRVGGLAGAGKVLIGDGTNFVPGDPFVQGVVAHDAAAAAIFPVLTGFYASAAAPGDVSADTDSVRAWALRNGSQVVNLATGGTLYDARSIRALSSAGDSVTIAGSIANTTFAATQGTSPWVISGAVTTSGTATVSGTVTADQGAAGANAWPIKISQATTENDVDVTSSALPTGASTSVLQGAGLPAALGAGGGVKIDGSGTALPVSGTVTANISGSISNTTFGATQGTSPWVISGAVTTSGTATVSGTVTADQGAAGASAWPIKISQAGTDNNVTFTNSTIGVTNAGLSNLDVALSTRTKPADQQHTIIDSGSISNTTFGATQGTSPWVVGQATGTNLHTVVDSGSVNAAISGSIGNTTFASTQGTSPWVVGQGTGSNLHTVVDSGSISATQGTSPWVVSGAVNTTSDAIVSAANSSTTPLGIGATFTGTGVDMLNYSTVRVSVFADQNSAASGWQVQFSEDNSNWDFVRSTTYTANIGGYTVFNRIARYMRVVFVNGAAGQTAFRLQTLIAPNSPEFARHFISEVPTDMNGSIITQAVISGKTTAGGGSYVAVKVNPSGALTTASTLDAETTKVIGTVRTLGNVGGVLDAAIGAAPPANGTPSPGLGSGATGGFLLNFAVCDTFANVNISTATTTLIVTGVSGRHVRICSMSLVTAAANNVALISGTGATCGTGTTGMNGTTTAASGWNFAANGGLTQGSGLGAINQTNATGDSVCIVTSAATQLSGRLSYAIY